MIARNVAVFVDCHCEVIFNAAQVRPEIIHRIADEAVERDVEVARSDRQHAVAIVELDVDRAAAELCNNFINRFARRIDEHIDFTNQREINADCRNRAFALHRDAAVEHNDPQFAARQRQSFAVNP